MRCCTRGLCTRLNNFPPTHCDWLGPRWRSWPRLWGCCPRCGPRCRTCWPSRAQIRSRAEKWSGDAQSTLSVLDSPLSLKFMSPPTPTQYPTTTSTTCRGSRQWTIKRNTYKDYARTIGVISGISGSFDNKLDMKFPCITIIAIKMLLNKM